MGYCVETLNVDFTIPADKLDEAYKALVELNNRDELKSGGAWGQLPDGKGYGCIEKYFSWMPANYPETCKDVAAVLKEVGFETSEEEEGLRVDWYVGEKSGDEAHFFEALAPFAKPGSYMEWEGEDRQRWRWEFDGTTMTTKTGTISWG